MYICASEQMMIDILLMEKRETLRQHNLKTLFSLF